VCTGLSIVHHVDLDSHEYQPISSFPEFSSKADWAPDDGVQIHPDVSLACCLYTTVLVGDAAIIALSAAGIAAVVVAASVAVPAAGAVAAGGITSLADLGAAGALLAGQVVTLNWGAMATTVGSIVAFLKANQWALNFLTNTAKSAINTVIGDLNNWTNACTSGTGNIPTL
jgi:hypothetical protein